MTEEGSPTPTRDRSPVNHPDGAIESTVDVDESRNQPGDFFGEDAPDDDDGFGDFDEFEEGGEGDDFGDFDDGFQQGEQEAETTFDTPQNLPPVPAPSPGPVSRIKSGPIMSLPSSIAAVKS